jgi:outer membrane PBP1 activator LpoA protein
MEERMDQQPKFQRIALVVLLALVTAACSSTGTGTRRVSMSSICKATGGTYSGNMCQPAPSAQDPAKLCAAHGGVYYPGGEYCEVDNSLLWKP